MNKEDILEYFKERTKIICCDSLNEYLELCLTNKTESKFEKHHILPRALFPEFDSFTDFPWNCANLSPKDHYLCHAILAKALDEDSMLSAWWQMNFKNFLPGQELEQQDIIGCELYSHLKENGRRLSSEINKNMVVALDLQTGKNKKVSKSEFDNDSTLVGATFGMISVTLKETGERVYLTKAEFDLNRDKYSHHLSDKITAKHKDTGEIISVSKEEFYARFDLVGLNAGTTRSAEAKSKTSASCKNNQKIIDSAKGMVLCKNIYTGETFRVPKKVFDNDPALVGINFGKTLKGNRNEESIGD